MKGKSLSRVRLLATPWTAAYLTPPSMGFSRQEYWSGVPLPSPPLFPSLLKFMSIESVMLSSHLILCHPLLLLPSIFSRHQGLFQRVGSSHQVAKVLALQPRSLNEYSVLIFFKISLKLDLLAVQETLKTLSSTTV